MYIMLCLFILFLGYLLFALMFYFMAKKLGLKLNVPVAALAVMCGIVFLGRMLPPNLPSHQFLWITIPDKLKNVDKSALIQCSFDYMYLQVLILIGWIDFKKKIIPNVLNGLILLLGALMQISTMMLPHILTSIISGDSISDEMIIEIVSFPERIIGLFILSVPLICIGCFYKGSFGMGDVKFLASAGFFMGWKNLIGGAFVGSLIAAVLCMISLIRHRMSIKDKIAYGPYLCIGMVLTTLQGWILL